MTQFMLLSSNGRIVGHWQLVFSPEDPSLIIQAITNGTATMVSNGSYKPFLSTEIGAAAWILECLVTQASCFGECSTTGTRNEVKPYRCEVQGCHAGLLGLLAFASYHQVHGVVWIAISIMTLV
jgi:hypothetical protein